MLTVMKIRIIALYVIALYASIGVFHDTPRVCAGQEDIDFLPQILSMPDIDIDSGIFFSDQNPGKARLMQRILLPHGYEEKIVINTESGERIRVLNLKKPIEKPVVEFKKINPTKYRLRVHKAKRGFPLIFSESFHEGWKAYIVRRQKLETGGQKTGDGLRPRFQPGGLPGRRGGAYALEGGQGTGDIGRMTDDGGIKSQNRNKMMLREYKILEGNEEDQVSLEELKVFLEKGFVSDLGDGQPKERKHFRYLGSGAEKLDHVEIYTIGFISKNLNGTIQNDNLPEGHFWESWLPGKFVVDCPRTKGKISEEACETDPASWKIDRGIMSDLIEWPDIFHWQVNGYANSWWIDPAILGGLPEASSKQQGYYILNPDGTMDFEVVLEFWPQRLYYIGLFISSTTLIFCLIYLIYRFSITRIRGNAGRVVRQIERSG